MGDPFEGNKTLGEIFGNRGQILHFRPDCRNVKFGEFWDIVLGRNSLVFKSFFLPASTSRRNWFVIIALGGR